MTRTSTLRNALIRCSSGRQWSKLQLFQGGTPHTVKRQLEDIEISQAARFRHSADIGW